MIRKSHRHGTIILLTILVTFFLLAGFAPLSTAAIIDNFSTPQGPLNDTIGGAVSGPGIIGGWRHAGPGGSFFEVAGGVATFSFLRSGNVMGITYNGTASVENISMFPPVDLTDGGIASHFLWGISGVEGAASMALGVIDVHGNSIATVFSGVFVPGLYALPLPAGLVDFTQIGWVSGTLFLSSIGSSEASVSIDFLCTGTPEGGCSGVAPVAAVPEPGTATLLALGSAMLVLLARRKVSRETLSLPGPRA